METPMKTIAAESTQRMMMKTKTKLYEDITFEDSNMKITINIITTDKSLTNKKNYSSRDKNSIKA